MHNRAVSAGGSVGLLLAGTAMLAACASPAPAGDTAAQEAASRPVISAAAVRCEDGTAFLIHYTEDTARLIRPADDRVLRRAISASGARYFADGLLVWEKGDETLIEVDGRRYTGCRSDPARAAWEQARLDGVDFRALGNEPGWILQIDEERGVTFVTDYGRSAHAFGIPVRRDPGGGRVDYRARGDSADIEVTLLFEVCYDDMSGEAFPVIARVRLEGRAYRGCGRLLAGAPPD